uniref:DNA-directed RNA polymerase subunit beta n=1 Tax=Lotharella vacuolata TaxID=74820 RepID=A0A0H5BHE7_9EUKA|nr:second-largest subunit of RNA polymerase III [Lotharella vacuolata]
MYKAYNSLLISNSTIFQQIKSFNLFLKIYINEILVRRKFLFFLLNKISIVIFNVQKFYMTFPMYFKKFIVTPITPQVCRVFSKTYSSLLLVVFNTCIKLKNIYKIKKRLVSLGKIPIMLRSNKCYLKHCNVFKMLSYGECPFELGGYFLIKGYEKVILLQEQIKKSFSELCSFKSGILFFKIPDFSIKSYKNFFLIIKNNCIFIRSKFFKNDLNFFFFLLILGFKKISILIDYINTKINRKITFYKIYMLKKKNIWKKQNSIFIQRIIKKKYFSLKLLTKILSFKEFTEILILPKFLSFKNDFSMKIIYIIAMLFKNLRNFYFTNTIKKKYSVQNIRYFLIGNIIKIEFNFLFTKLIKNFISLVKRKIISINEFGLLIDSSNISQEIITNGLEYSIKSGIFSNNYFNKTLYSSCQILGRLSFISTLSLLTKINSFVDKKRKVLIPRLIFSSNWCRICPFETPEGESCGLIKNLSIIVSVSDPSLDKVLIYLLIIIGTKRRNVFLISKNAIKKITYVFINNILIGFHQNFVYTYYILKSIRKFLFNSLFFNIYIETSMIYLNCDSGRLLRPLLTREYCKRNFFHIVKKKIIFFKKKLINYFINNGMIEILDIGEEYNSVIGSCEAPIHEQTTHLEIDSYCLFGFCLSVVPFALHNQSPRNTYHVTKKYNQCSMQKQSIGNDIINKLILSKNTIEILWFPQRAIITTTISNLYGIDLLGSAQNIIISMLSSGTYNIEDALILSNCSNNFGLFRSYVRKCINYEKFPKLIKKINNFLFNINANYNHVTKKKKIMQIKNNNKTKISKKYYILNKNKFIKPIFNNIKMLLITKHLNIMILFENQHTTEIGDKFASRHGQKGIIGNLIKKEDLPFSLLGIVPELIMNPHGIPSRMTIGQILETVASKAIIHYGLTSIEKSKGFFYNCFLTINDIGNFLNNKNQNCYGKETMICGVKNNLLNTAIYLGPVFYQKLNHLVTNKIFARNFGKRNVLTRQPSKGKKNNGGLKIGEMEKDCIAAYGCSIVLIERMIKNSDGYKIKIDKSCGYAIKGKSTYNRQMVVEYLKLPYSFELLFKELEAVCISVRIKMY